MVWKNGEDGPGLRKAGNGETPRRLIIPGICRGNKANSSGPGLFQASGCSGIGMRKKSGGAEAGENSFFTFRGAATIFSQCRALIY